MARKKTPQHSKIDNGEAKKGYVVADYYLDMHTFEQIHISENGISRLAIDLFQWAIEDKDALKITQFFIDRGISTSTMYRWIEKYPIFKTAYEESLLAIGNRREIGALKKKYSESVMQRVQSQYCPAWARAEERSWKLRQQEQDNDNSQRIVIIERFPESDLVPVKQKREE